MKGKSKVKATAEPSLTGVATNPFDFELWVKQVRPQLLASVQKRLR